MAEDIKLEATVPISAPDTPQWSLLGTVTWEPPTYDRNIGLMDAPFSPDQIGRLRRLADAHGWGVLELEAKDPDVSAEIARCEILCGYFPKRLLKQAKALRWLHLPSAGADRYTDESIYPHKNVTLTCSSGAFGTAIAEQLLMGTLMLLRRMPEYQKQQREKVWGRVGPLGFLRGSTVLVLGTGDLGGTFGDYCAHLGAIVHGVNRSGVSEKTCFAAVHPVTALSDVVQGADVVAACLPLTAETAGLIDQEILFNMKPGSIFLNVGRGKTVNQDDLIAALRQGPIAGAMLDVFAEEPLPPDSPLWDMEQVIITPHISGSDLDADNAAAIFSIFCDNLTRYFAKKPLRNIVDKAKGYSIRQ